MSGIKRGAGVYTFRVDKDADGEYFWIVAPSGELIAHVVTTREMVDELLGHLNRGRGPEVIATTKVIDREVAARLGLLPQ